MTLFLYECLRAIGLQQHYDTFTSMGVHHASQLSELTMEDYPILGIRTMEDRTRLFHLVQLVKSFDQGNLDYSASTDGRYSAADHYTEGSGKCYNDYGEPYEDVCDEEEERNAAMRKTDTVTFSKPSRIRKRLDFSSEITDHQQKQFSGPVDTRQVCASYDRIHESVHSHMQHNSETGNTVVYGCRGNRQRVNVQSCSFDNHRAGGITKQSGTTGGDSVLNSCTKSPPNCDSFQKPTTKSVTITPRRLNNKRSGHKENVSPQRKGTSNKTKLQSVRGINESSKWFSKAIPVYKAMRPSGYNYGLPLSSICTPNQRLVGDQRISVCVRKRPLTHVEKRRREADVVTTPGGECIIVHESKEAVDLSQYILQHRFYFDQVFGEENSNDEVYQRTTYPLVQHMLNGGKATCFAYGQTGAGKTHTMLGSSPGKLGLYALAAQDIFSYISTTRSHSHLTVYISFFEIYCGHLYDLLDHRKRLFAREDGQKMVHIAGLCHIRVDSVNSLLEVISQGTEERTQGMSGVNPLSSRSHALLQIQLRDPNQQTFGRMWFVDLAGSERASDSKEPDKQSRMEGAEINQSLLALKECIRSLDQEQSHTPFRQSKLTQVLKDSFVGDSMTCMIANISPCNSATEHTLNTLRYADRVKELKGLGGHRRGRRGRRGKTAPSPKQNLSNSNSSTGGSSVGARGKSPPKKQKLQREAFGPTTPTMKLPKGGAFLCSTPRNNRWGEEINVLEINGNVFDDITPIRCSKDSGDKRQRREGDDKSGIERWSKDDRYPFSDQNTNPQLALKQPKYGQPHFWEEQRNRIADEGNLCLGQRHSGFCNRGEEKQQDISTKQQKEMEMRCREQAARVESNKDTCDDMEKMRDDLQVNERKKEREKHLRLYHQQLQQFVPSPVSASSSNQPLFTSFPSSSSNVSISPLRYDRIEEVLDVYRARVEVRAHSNRGLLPIPSEQVCLQSETFPSYNRNNNEAGQGGSVGADAQWKATETNFQQTDNGFGSDRRTPYEVKWEGEARVRRSVQIEGDRKWAWVATAQNGQADRITGAMPNDVEVLMSNSCDSEEIRLESHEEVDASADGVWSIEDAEEPGGLGSNHSNSENISVFNLPPAESASQKAPAERPLSPTSEHNNTLLTLSYLNHSLGSKQSRCTSKILNTSEGVPSNSCELKKLRVPINASKRELTSLSLTTCIKHNNTEPFNTLPDNLSCNQIHNCHESKAKMSGLHQEESFADFLNNSTDPLSISMLQVDQQAATNSFLQGKESIHSLCPPHMEGGEDNRRKMEKEFFTREKMRGKVEEDKDVEFHMSLLENIYCSATSDDRLGMRKYSTPVSRVAHLTTEPLDITASVPPLKSTHHTSLQTSAIQSKSPSVNYPGPHYLITHSATQMPPQCVHNIHSESASSIPATQMGSTQDNSNTVLIQHHSAHSGHTRESNKLPLLTTPRQPNNKVQGTTNQQVTSMTNLEDLDEVQWCVTQAHWKHLKEMEALTHKEGSLLCQQPDMTFAEYINQLEVLMERKAKCVHSMIAQLQPHLKSSPSSHQQHKQEDGHNRMT